jgi:hypothetical protein
MPARPNPTSVGVAPQTPDHTSAAPRRLPTGARVTLTPSADVCGTTSNVCRPPHSQKKIRQKRDGSADACQQTSANIRVPKDVCHKTSAHRRLPKDVCPQTSANRRLPNVPDVCQHRQKRDGCADICQQTSANIRLPKDVCQKTSAHRRLPTDVCQQASANRRLPNVCRSETSAGHRRLQSPDACSRH